ncbi:hypothetical protein L3081_19045 [Colwellia sp. MSW7]|uniref:Uncharacterized protein n=1 Tax=Colwellia maritima TaxID=2912588 RepID=A0ABS9X4I9_9GAMM|nr:hypothetical protein [Colwellia maritima]MCI2285099.1 hypothetical protein [Colwellia maritima]
MLFSVAVYGAVSNINGASPFSEGNFFSTKITNELDQIDNYLRHYENRQETRFLKAYPQLFLQTQGSDNLCQLQAKARDSSLDKFSSDDYYDLHDILVFTFYSKFAYDDLVDRTRSMEEKHVGIKLGLAYKRRDWLSNYARFNYSTFDITQLMHDYDLQAFSADVVGNF